MKKIILGLVLVNLLAACASQAPTDGPKAAVEERSATTAQTKPAEMPRVGMNPLTDPASILSKRSVYYELDMFDVKDEYKPMIEAHAKYLNEHAAARTTLQGNCDERGSREYNLALGQKRAESVKKIMSVLGVSDKQIETTSFGEEKPKAECHDESCWQKNRRTDIVYPGE